MCAPALLVVASFAVAACESGADNRATSSTRRAPQQVYARSVGGAAGSGPIVPPDGGNRVDLPDRTLIVNKTTREGTTSRPTVAVRVAVTIQNTGNAAIPNARTFFSVIGTEGDILGARPDRAASFVSDIPAHATRTGTITFDVPAATASKLQLLYRPVVAGQTVVVPLHGV